MRPVRATTELPWTDDPRGDVRNAYAIPADHGMCLLCFGDRTITVDYRDRTCPLCKGTGVQTPELVWNYRKGENMLDQLQLLA